MKQTAVEWLANSIIKLEERFRLKEININDFIEEKDLLIEKAIKIEKKQIEKTFVDVTKATLQNLGIEPTLRDLIDFKKIAEVYYNEEFKNTNL